MPGSHERPQRSASASDGEVAVATVPAPTPTERFARPVVWRAHHTGLRPHTRTRAPSWRHSSPVAVSGSLASAAPAPRSGASTSPLPRSGGRIACLGLQRRATDVRHGEWIAELLRHGLLQPSFIPARPQREPRELTRSRTSLVRERAAEVNRLQKVLEGANSKLTSVDEDITGASGHDMLVALVEGTTPASALAQLARGRLREQIPQLEQVSSSCTSTFWSPSNLYTSISSTGSLSG
ncbi:MAG: IS110 family transposase [Ktedonobacterales bacterium]